MIAPLQFNLVKEVTFIKEALGLLAASIVTTAASLFSGHFEVRWPEIDINITVTFVHQRRVSFPIHLSSLHHMQGLIHILKPCLAHVIVVGVGEHAKCRIALHLQAMLGENQVQQTNNNQILLSMEFFF